MPYRIRNRWPAWAKWRIVGPRPHDERYPYDSKGLVFQTREDAEQAAARFRAANDGEYEVVEECAAQIALAQQGKNHTMTPTKRASKGRDGA